MYENIVLELMQLSLLNLTKSAAISRAQDRVSALLFFQPSLSRRMFADEIEPVSRLRNKL